MAAEMVCDNSPTEAMDAPQRRRGRPRKLSVDAVSLNLKISQELARALDQIAHEIESNHPGIAVSRADAVRHCIEARRVFISYNSSDVGQAVLDGPFCPS